MMLGVETISAAEEPNDHRAILALMWLIGAAIAASCAIIGTLFPDLNWVAFIPFAAGAISGVAAGIFLHATASAETDACTDQHSRFSRSGYPLVGSKPDAEIEEGAKKRRLQEIEQFTAAMREMVRKVNLIEERIGEGIRAKESASLKAQEAEIEAIVERAMRQNPLIVEDLKSIRATLLTIRQELAASRSAPVSWDVTR